MASMPCWAPSMVCKYIERSAAGPQAYDISNLKRLRVLELRADESLHETFVAELGRLPPSLRSASLIAPQVWSVTWCLGEGPIHACREKRHTIALPGPASLTLRRKMQLPLQSEQSFGFGHAIPVLCAVCQALTVMPCALCSRRSWRGRSRWWSTRCPRWRPG